MTQRSRSDGEAARTREPPKRPASIHDVAERAGVSIKTVSRVLNREPNVSPATRERVQQAVATLRYRPNIFARSLASERSFLIALLFDNPSPAYVAAVQFGALARCRERGFHLIVEALDSKAEGIEETALALLAETAPHGLILTPPLSDCAPLLEALRAAGAQVARMAPAETVPGMAEVRIDDRAAARDMTAHLIALGHRRIGLIKGHPDHAASAARFEGYRNALAEAGIGYEPALIAQGYFDFESGFEAAERLLALSPRPSAIFASNDDMAAAALAAAQKKGLSVPGALSVAGFDDSLAARLIWPGLTTCRQPLADMAAAAVSLLTRRVGEEPPPRLAHEVVARESTAPPAV